MTSLEPESTTMEEFLKLSLAPGKHKVYGRRSGLALVKGGGKRQPDLGTASDLAKTVLKKTKGRSRKREPLPEPIAEIIEGFRLTDRSPQPAKSRRRRQSSAAQPPARRRLAAPGGEQLDPLTHACEVVQSLLEDGAYDGIWDRIFGSMLRIADQAQSNPQLAKFKRPMADHAAAVRKVRATVSEALPQIIDELQSEHPDAPHVQLLSQAVQGIYEQIAPYLQLLELYTTALSQYAGGEDAEALKVINAFMESTFVLSLTGDLDAVAEGKPVKQIIPTQNIKVGDLILTGFMGERGGLGTIPLGPVNCHLLLVPPDMKRAMAAFMTPLTHEGGHQFNADVEGFQKEQRQIVEKAVRKAFSDGLVLSVSQYKLGKAVLPADDLMVKLFTDWAEEITGDLRALLGHGVAFGLNSLFAFPAMSSTPARLQRQKLRSHTSFSLVKTRTGTKLEFEAHPIDIVRSFGVHADALELLSLTDNADYIRQQSLLAVGGRLPESVFFELDGEGQDLTIEMPMSDVLAVSKVVTDAIMHTPMKSLNNGQCDTCDLSLRSIVSWDGKREAKALDIGRAFAQGHAVVPANIGTVFRPYVVSGAVHYLWETAQKGLLSKAVMVQLWSNMTAMLMQCRA